MVLYKVFLDHDAETIRWHLSTLLPHLEKLYGRRLAITALDLVSQYEQNGEFAVLLVDKEGKPAALLAEI